VTIAKALMMKTMTEILSIGEEDLNQEMIRRSGSLVLTPVLTIVPGEVTALVDLEVEISFRPATDSRAEVLEIRLTSGAIPMATKSPDPISTFVAARWVIRSSILSEATTALATTILGGKIVAHRHLVPLAG